MLRMRSAVPLLRPVSRPVPPLTEGVQKRLLVGRTVCHPPAVPRCVHGQGATRGGSFLRAVQGKLGNPVFVFADVSSVWFCGSRSWKGSTPKVSGRTLWTLISVLDKELEACYFLQSVQGMSASSARGTDSAKRVPDYLTSI